MNMNIDDFEHAKLNKFINEYNAMQLELDAIRNVAKERKETIDRLSAEISKWKRKDKRNKNATCNS